MVWKTVQTNLMNKDIVSGIIARRSERNTGLENTDNQNTEKPSYI